MPPRPLDSWEDVGRRVAEARRLSQWTQQELADKLSLDRTAVAKIESGQRRLDALELGRLASAFARTPEWFVTAPPPAVVSRRAELSEESAFPHADDLLERLARDVEFLVEIECLRPPPQERLQFGTVEEAERGAARVRRVIDATAGPLVDLQLACERIGMYSFSFMLDESALDGAYVALSGGGVALINGGMDSGRRRFNLAHELGHHALADEYSTDIGLGDDRSDRERMINAFAVHLLMPRESIRQRWSELDGQQDARQALIRISVEFRVSWTAACGHARNLGLVSTESFERLVGMRPTRGEHLEVGLPLAEELLPDSLPPGYVAGVMRAFRRNKISAGRAVELLHGSVTVEELPSPDAVPLESLRPELEALA